MAHEDASIIPMAVPLWFTCAVVVLVRTPLLPPPTAVDPVALLSVPLTVSPGLTHISRLSHTLFVSHVGGSLPDGAVTALTTVVARARRTTLTNAYFPAGQV